MTPVKLLIEDNPNDPPHPYSSFPHKDFVAVIETALAAEKLTWSGCVLCCRQALDGLAQARLNERGDIALLVLFSISDRICEHASNLLYEINLPSICDILDLMIDCVDAELARLCGPQSYAMPLILYTVPDASCGPAEAMEELRKVGQELYPDLSSAQIEPLITRFELKLQEVTSERNLRHSH